MLDAARNPLKLFYCYAHEDKILLQALAKHLSNLKRQGLIETWHDQEISAGSVWKREIDEQLNSAHIILLLISADFLASDYCYCEEMERAVQRHKEGTVRVIPIILRPVDWKGTPFSELQALPTGAKPVTKWEDVDDAYKDIAESLRVVVEELHAVAQLEQENDEISNLEEDLRSLDDVTILQFEKDIHISAEEIDNYYKGKLLSWEIILAQADVVRDQQEGLVETYLQPVQKTRMLCLCGEPGAGKSTLARRIAFEITQRSKQLLIQIDDNETGGVWRQLNKILAKYTIPVVILVDDVFRSNEAKRALKNFNNNLNVTIIATSCSNEITADVKRVPFLDRVDVKAPSKNEKTRVMEKLQKGALSEPQLKRLNQADLWVVMMMELTSGEGLKEIVQDSIRRLEHNPRIHQAYKYLCYAGIYQLSIPATLLLEAADARYYRLKDDPAGESLIFYSENSENYSTLHPVFAEAAFEEYMTDADAVIMRLIEVLQLNQRSHRVFLCTLFYRSMKEQEALIKDLLVQKASKIVDILNISTHSELWYYWRGLFNQLGDVEKIALIEDMMVTKIPEAPLDWIAYFKFLNEKGLHNYHSKVIEVARDWFKANAEDRDACVAFLGAVERWGTEGLWMALLEDINQWLIVHQEDFPIRAAYLVLVGSRGKEEHWNATIEDTLQWLRAHKEDTHVRMAYLALVEKRGKEEHWDTAIKSTTRWLKTQKEDSQVRMAYLALVEKRGQEPHWKNAIEDTAQWLRTHPDESNLRKPYLALVDKRGQENDWEVAIEDTLQWLRTHGEDSQVRAAYLALVEKRGKEAHWGIAIEDITQWLRAYPDESNLRKSYLALVDSRGQENDWDVAIEDTTQWLRMHPDEGNLRKPYLALVDSRGQEEHWHIAIEDTTQWLRTHPNESNLRKSYLALVDSRGQEEHWHVALRDTANWLTEHKEEVFIYIAYLELAERRGKEEDCTIAIENAVQWLQKNKEDSQVRTAYLRMIARRGTLEQRKAVIEDTTRWVEVHSRDAHPVINAYFALIDEKVYEYDTHIQIIYLGMVERYGTTAYRKEVIEETRQWLKTHEANVNVRGAYLRLVDKRGKEEHWSRVIEETRTWFQTHEGDFNVRVPFLGLVDRRGREKHWYKVIEETRQWLEAHEADVNVRGAYLRLVDKRGKEEHWDKAIEETRAWLRTHETDFNVRAPFLGFVDRRGKEEHWDKVIEETREWLQAHPQDFLVRAPFLGFVDRRGKEEHWDKVIEETRAWLQAHETDFSVRAPYMGLVDRRGNEEHWYHTIEDTTRWLQIYKEDFNVRAPYLGLVARRGNGEQLVTVYHFTEDWLTEHPAPKNLYLIYGYGKILLKLNLYEQAEKQFLRVLDVKKAFVPARIDLAWSYYYQGKKEEAYRELLYSQRQVESGNEYPIGTFSLNLGRYWMLENMLDTALECFQVAVTKDPSFYQCHMEAGQAYLALKKYSQALQALKRAKDLLPKNVRPEIVQDIDKRIAEALEHQEELKPVVKRKKRKRYRKSVVQMK